MAFGTVEQAIRDIRDGRLVVVADDEGRENEGDLVAAAQRVTPEMVNFMAMHGRGLICLALTPERCTALGLPQMTERNGDPRGTAFTVTVDAHDRFGIASGASASDRATTIRVALDPASTAGDLRRPGHIAPLQARPKGVFERRGQTEASVDLARLAGLAPAGVICEILADDGSMMRRAQLARFAKAHGLTLITVAQIVDYRLAHERVVHRCAQTHLPTPYGDFRVIAYRSDAHPGEHLAFLHGDGAGGGTPLVRVHSKCLTGEAFHSLRCDCGWQLRTAMQMIAAEKAGVVVYLDQEGRGIGLLNKIRAYELQDAGYDTVEANVRLGFAPDPRDFRIAAQILRDLGVTSVRLLSNNPRKAREISAHGVRVEARMPLTAPATESNRSYLDTKREKLGHVTL